jgi:hypothetical protein
LPDEVLPSLRLVFAQSNRLFSYVFKYRPRGEAKGKRK